MNRFYSIMLLLSFFIGTLQPVMPMVEFVIYEGRLLELIQPIADEDCTMTALQEICEECDCCNHNDSDELLNFDYYPIHLEVMPSVAKHVSLETQLAMQLTDESTIAHPYSTPTPPPRSV